MHHDMIRNPYQLRPLMEEIVALDERGEAYTFTPHTNPDGPVLFYMVPNILKWCQEQGRPELRVAVNPKYAARLCEVRGIDPAEAERVLHRRLANKRALTPCLIADFGETQVVIDGNHRFVACGMQGEGTVPAYMIPQDELEREGLCRMLSRNLYNTMERMEAAAKHAAVRQVMGGC